MSMMKGKRLVLLLIFVLAVTPLLMAAGQANANNQSLADEITSKRGQDGVEQGVVLVSEGNPSATVVTTVYASALEKKAATEVVNYIKSISGAELPIVTNVGEATGTKIYIGGAAPNIDLNAIRQGGEDPASFRLIAAADSIRLYGLSDQGTLFAAFELLEQIGVRWFMPGDIGTVIPSKNTIALSMQDTIQHPGFSARAMQATEAYQKPPGLPNGVNLNEGKPWVEHMRLNQKFYGTHGIPCTITSKARPDLFLPNENGTPTNQFDVTKPDVLACVVQSSIQKLQKDPNLKVLSMGPNDGLVKVLQPNPDWDGNDLDATHDTLSLTDRYVKFINLVLEQLEQAGYPDVSIAFYAYDTYYQPPVRWTPHSRLIPIIASITVDRYHAIDNPLSWERGHLKDMIDGWRNLGVQPQIYQYLYNLADPGLPFSVVDQVYSEFKYYKQNGITGIRAENLPAWAYHGPGLYLAAKMMWNPDLDVEALLDDYYRKFYGPAAESMREHFETLEHAFANADYFVGNIYDFPHILTDKVRQELEKTLGKAEKEANKSNDPVYGKRVAMVRLAYSFGDNFLGMMDSMNRLDFVKAKEQFDRIYALRNEAVLHSPVILNPWASFLYTDIFWKKMVTEGEQRVTGGNRIVAQLPDEWNVMLFPHENGDLLGLWKPGLGTKSWMKLKTYSETWSSQGLRYYKGHAWYRTEVKVDKKFDNGNPIRLWFSSIDESARVWMNGQELPLVKKGSGLTSPWEFDATNAIQFGESNLIVVDVGNMILDELGTGGITGPAMLWEAVSN
ncbi:DUF4838 domain-containing protein [Paenibacillus mesophilus]|nr:DUF4838 domain-containing protein [Paenibacillus mesophilus]